LAERLTPGKPLVKSSRNRLYAIIEYIDLSG
jgi:hypothetical protein